MGRVAIIRDMAAVTYARPAADGRSYLNELPQFRGYDLLLVHRRGDFYPI
jgi:hypothetical protein